MLRMLVWEVVPGRGQKGPGSPGGRVARMTPAHPGFLGVATVGARFLNTEVRGLLGGHHELTTYSMRRSPAGVLTYSLSQHLQGATVLQMTHQASNDLSGLGSSGAGHLLIHVLPEGLLASQNPHRLASRGPLLLTSCR